MKLSLRGPAVLWAAVLGAAGLLLALGWWWTRPAPIASTRIPEQALRAARARWSGPRAARVDPPSIEVPASDVARIAQTLGSFVVACEFDGFTPGVRPIELPGGRFWRVPGPDGALPIVAPPDFQAVGAFRWEGAGPDRVGTCRAEEGSVRVTGVVRQDGEPRMAGLVACGVSFGADVDGSFAVDLPRGARCDVESTGSIVSPAVLDVGLADHAVDLELAPDPDAELPSLVGVMFSLAGSLLSPLSASQEPGDYERALDAPDLAPETVEWLIERAAAEHVAREELSRRFRAPMAWYLVVGFPTAEDLTE